MEVTPRQALDIVHSHDGDQTARIASFSDVSNTSYSYAASATSYHIVVLYESGKPKSSYLLLTCPLAPPPPPPPPPPLTLPALSTLLTTILDKTAVPIPRPIAHDVSGGGGKWPFSWLLLIVPASQTPIGPLTSLASVRNRLSLAQRSRIELRLGTHLRALHGITHDWFGSPMDEPAQTVPSFAALLGAGHEAEDGDGQNMTPYSWQDTFVLRLEELLDRVAPSRHNVNVVALRHALTRAIGSFLFDDVEIPRLIWVTGNDEDVVVSLKAQEGGDDGESTASEQDAEADIVCILPTFRQALWGDPLLETWFLPPGPSAAMMEGYFGDEKDGTLIVFPRHKTKRLWYTVYLALTVLAEEMSRGGKGETTGVTERETVRWAKDVLPECEDMLQNAPCY